jgi:hypothetical protein
VRLDAAPMNVERSPYQSGRHAPGSLDTASPLVPHAYEAACVSPRLWPSSWAMYTLWPSTTRTVEPRDQASTGAANPVVWRRLRGFGGRGLGGRGVFLVTRLPRLPLRP